MAVHEGAFMLLFTRQLGGQRVSQTQDGEDTQQQFSRACPHSIKDLLAAFYPWRHSREKMYQALSPFSKRREAGWGLGTRLGKDVAYKLTIKNVGIHSKLSLHFATLQSTCRHVH